MADGGFGPDDVVNRRVNRHLTELLPSRVSTQRDYHLEGQRSLPPEQVPDIAETCFCHLEAYVGRNGRFEINVERVFDRGTEHEWTCDNRISRGESGSRPPFEYTVRTTLALMGDTHVDRSHVEWTELGSDPVYGGHEAQAAVLLTEKMSHMYAREDGNPMNHCGSLSSLGSFSNVVDSGRQIEADWNDVDELLGPDAETVAATSSFDELVSDERRQRATQRGFDFLAEDFPESLDEYEDDPGSGGSAGAESDGAARPWQTAPAEMSTAEAEARLGHIRRRIREMKDESGTDSRDR